MATRLSTIQTRPQPNPGKAAAPVTEAATVPSAAGVATVDPRRARRIALINRAEGYLGFLALGWLGPLARIVAGDRPRPNLLLLWQGLVVPMLGLGLFLLLWSATAPRVQTSLGALPGPAQVAEQAGVLWTIHTEERARAAEFHARQDERNARYIAEGTPERVRHRAFTGAPTFIDQIYTSLRTVGMGFVLATLFAVPLGVVAGLSRTFGAALNPLIQLFKPVSPLAWLPIVTMVVSALYTAADPMFDKAFVISAITVTLCSLWPTLINTTVGVSSIDKDLLNVGKVLQLSWFTNIRKVVLPSALPFIFTGLRLSLGVGWMVLIAAEMLAQNPGLGKFVWDEFQNGSSASLAKIIVAVLTIGVIGFLLDRIMLAVQAAVTHTAAR